MSEFETWFKTSGWPEKHKIACQDAWECCTGSGEHIHDLEVKSVRLEKENAELRLQLDIAHKFYEELLNEIPEGLAEFKALSLKDMTDYYFKKLELLKEQGNE